MSFISNLFKTKIPVRITSVTKLEAPEILQEESINAVILGDWFTSKEHYLEFKAAFKKWATERKYLNSSHFILYALLRNRQWLEGWTAPNPKSLGKVDQHYWKKIYAFTNIKSGYNETELLAPFDGTITTAMLKTIRENIEYLRKGPFGVLRGE